MPRLWLLTVLRNLLQREKLEKDLDEEVRSYVDLLADEKRAAGLPEQVAGRAAIVEVGGLEQVKEHVRQQRAGAVLEHVLQDARYGTRMAARNPIFACVVILTLAIGIGATTAVFGIVDAVLLNPLPFARPDRIVTVWQHSANAPEGFQLRTWWRCPSLCGRDTRLKISARCSFATHYSELKRCRV